MATKSPFSTKRHEVVAAVAQATSTGVPVAVVAAAGTVDGVTYTPTATITGAATNTRKVSLINKGQSGAGSTVVATLQFNSGTNATGYDETAITLSGTAANLNVAAGDVLAWQSDSVGTGLADPGGLVAITFGRSVGR